MKHIETVTGWMIGGATLVLAACASHLSEKEMKPPIAEKIQTTLVTAGHSRIDPYYWLKERDNPRVREYLEEENAYADRMMDDTRDLQQAIYDEITSRIVPNDQTVPYFHNGYFYYTRDVQGKEYSLDCRRKGTLDAKEEILLDENELAEHSSYLNVGDYIISPDNRLMSFSIDTTGSKIYTIRFKDLQTGELLPTVIEHTNGDMVWAADSRNFFYCHCDRVSLRPNRLMRIDLSTGKQDTVYTETDEAFDVAVDMKKSDKIIYRLSASSTETEWSYLPADLPDGEFRIIQPRQSGLEYEVDDYGDNFYIVTNDHARNFRLMMTPIAHPSRRFWKEVVPHRDDVLLENIELFDDFMVLSERKDGMLRFHVFSKYHGDHYVDFPEEVYLVDFDFNEMFNTHYLRFSYSSLTTPETVYDYDMLTREMILRKQDVVPNYIQDNYVAHRLWATANDGVEIPLSIVHRKDLTIDGHTPLLLYGYGAYGINVKLNFRPELASLLDRGFICAIAHVRGGSYLGHQWYEQGKMLKKRNTFTDFIACSEYLIAQGYTDSNHLFARGASAGGLLMGAIINMRGELFKGVVADVPFVDVVTTMNDKSIPLTTGEFDEWGNPEDEKYYRYMMSYSPYDNVTAKAYPNMLVTAGLNDSQVQYWEPAKWVAKLRNMKTDNNMLLLHTNMEAGHGGASGRFEQYHEIAFQYAFFLKLLNKNKKQSQ